MAEQKNILAVAVVFKAKHFRKKTVYSGASIRSTERRKYLVYLN
jgi:hypothetical protein